MVLAEFLGVSDHRLLYGAKPVMYALALDGHGVVLVGYVRKIPAIVSYLFILLDLSPDFGGVVHEPSLLAFS